MIPGSCVNASQQDVATAERTFHTVLGQTQQDPEVASHVLGAVQAY